MSTPLTQDDQERKSVFSENMNDLFSQHEGKLPHPVLKTLDRVRLGSISVGTIARLLVSSEVGKELHERVDSIPPQEAIDLLGAVDLLGQYMRRDIEELESWIGRRLPVAPNAFISTELPSTAQQTIIQPAKVPA